ncbi:hypothetical protein EJ110_NYTH27820 [Nymphaea thermarum]|nr:hypothetical protein EJ110_NYTH27820 [Nymphaea thermarum]
MKRSLPVFIGSVAYKLSKRKSDDTLKMLHAIIYGRRGKLRILVRTLKVIFLSFLALFGVEMRGGGSESIPRGRRKKNAADEVDEEKERKWSPLWLMKKFKTHVLLWILKGKKASKAKDEPRKKEKAGPTEEELRKAICDILKEVDFNTVETRLVIDEDDEDDAMWLVAGIRQWLGKFVK